MVVLRAVLAAVLVGAGLGALLWLPLRDECGSDRIATAQTTTRLYCVSTVQRVDGTYLVVTNRPDDIGDDVSLAEAGAAVRSALADLPARYAGACSLRRGLDDVPQCTARTSGRPASGAGLRIVADHQDRLLLLLLIGSGAGLCGLVALLVAAARWGSGPPTAGNRPP